MKRSKEIDRISNENFFGENWSVIPSIFHQVLAKDFKGDHLESLTCKPCIKSGRTID